MIGGGRKCVLVGAAVDRFAHQLFGCRIGQRAHSHVRLCEPTDVVDIAGYSEVGQEDSRLTIVVEMSHHDVGGLDVTVQQALFVGAI